MEKEYKLRFEIKMVILMIILLIILAVFNKSEVEKCVNSGHNREYCERVVRWDKMTWIYSILIFGLIVLAIFIITRIFVFICDLLNLDALGVAVVILFMVMTGIIIYAIHEIFF